MNTLYRISISLNFWRIAFLLMTMVAVTTYAIRPRVVVKRETIYLIFENVNDKYPIETRVI